MSERKYMWVMLMAAVLAFFGCGHRQPVGIAETQPTLANIQAAIFTPRCATSGCHVPDGAGPMPLRNEQESFLSLVNRPSTQLPSLLLVKPGDPVNSYLLLKLKGDSAINGGRMPLGENALGSADIGLIEAWISDSGQDN